MAQRGLRETLMWVNIQRLTGVAHCANVVWPDLVTHNTLHIRLAAYAMISTMSGR